jgi:hypothetical protein
MTHEEENVHLRAGHHALREALNHALAPWSQVREEPRPALVRIEEREMQKTPPACVTANVKKPHAEETKQRKTGAPKHTHGRPHSAPTSDSWSIGS